MKGVETGNLGFVQSTNPSASKLSCRTPDKKVMCVVLIEVAEPLLEGLNWRYKLLKFDHDRMASDVPGEASC
jgi:hypothetical protein